MPTNSCSQCGVVIGRHKRKTSGQSKCRPCRCSETDVRYIKNPCSGCGQKVVVRQGKSTPMCRQCRAVKRTKTCVGCLINFTASTKNAVVQKYCSYECAMQHRVNWNKKTTDLVLYTGPRLVDCRPMPPPPKRRFKSVKCRQCSTMFLTLNVDVTCSALCQKINIREQRSQAKSRRRARKKQAFVENVSPRYIFKRDNYRCNLKLSVNCNGKTDPRKVVPHPRAPTLDHIIPLNAGVENDGWHSKANNWTACFECNCMKSDRGGGEQLALIG